MTTIILASTSNIKKDAVLSFFKDQYREFILEQMNCDHLSLPDQPIDTTDIDGGFFCCYSRYQYVKNRLIESGRLTPDSNIIIVSIENSISPYQYLDICHVIIGNLTITTHSISNKKIPFDKKYIKILERQNKSMYGYTEHTIGDIIAQDRTDLKVDPKNWMASVKNIDRGYQIFSGIVFAYQKFLILQKAKIHHNYPKEGVDFLDVQPILSDATVFNTLIDVIVNELEERYTYKQLCNVKYILGLDARGFIFGSVLARSLNKGFVMVRKVNKLPGDVNIISYEKEYGMDQLCLQKDIIESGDSVIIVDDILATGGSLKASCQLVEQIGGKVLCCCTVSDVPQLRNIASEKLKGYDIVTVCKNL